MRLVHPFTTPKIPRLTFQSGCIDRIPEALASHGAGRIAVLTGGRSVRGRDQWSALVEALLDRGIEFVDVTVRGEPSPELVDQSVDQMFREIGTPEAVVAIGGGSVLDAGKAVAAMVATRTGERTAEGASPNDGPSVARYLEGVGDLTPTGETVPVLAVPATAGTGSEATNNAVLSRTGPDGFKKSLRHENYVPDHAFLDPELQRGAPALVTLSAGLDAVTQLLEAYVSTQANPVTDAVAREGLVLAGASLPRLSAGEDSTELRGGMGLAAFLSGVALAGAGLGAVHGLASPVGALRDIPHGVVCGRLAAPVTRRVVASLKESGADESVRRYAEAAGLFLGAEASGDRSTGERIDLLVRRIEALADALPTFSAYGFVEADLDGLAERAGLKNTPAALSRPDLVGALRDAL